MPQVQLDEEVFGIAKRRASEGGFASVDAYITDMVVRTQPEETGNVDHLFTPERITELEAISAEIRAGGKTYTVDEVREHFENKRKEWLANHKD